MLVEGGLLAGWQLDRAIAHHERWGGDLADLVSELGFLPAERVMGAIARRLGVAYVDVGRLMLDPAVVELLPLRVARARGVLPLRLGSGRAGAQLVVATRWPRDLDLLDEVAFATGLPVRPVLASASAIERVLAAGADRRTPRARAVIGLPPPPDGPMRLVPVGESIY